MQQREYLLYGLSLSSGSLPIHSSGTRLSPRLGPNEYAQEERQALFASLLHAIETFFLSFPIVEKKVEISS